MSSKKRSAKAAFKAAQGHVIAAKKILLGEVGDSRNRHLYHTGEIVARLTKIQEGMGAVRLLIDCGLGTKKLKSIKTKKEKRS